MRGRTPETWRVDEQAYLRWLAGRESALKPAVALEQPSLKSIVALALLDMRDKSVSYDRLRARILRQNVLRAKTTTGHVELSIPTLRVAVSELGRQLNDDSHPFRLKTSREGKEARFQIVAHSTSCTTPNRTSPLDTGANLVTSMCQIIPGKSTIATDPHEIGHALIRDGGGLPFASFYSNYRTAAQWLAYSSRIGSTKKEYEAEAFFAYDLADKLFKGNGPHSIGVLGLGPGEGLGEVELLSRLLRGNMGKAINRVHYLAVDTSELLLTGHTCLIRERFHREIMEGRLIVAPVLGDLFQLAPQIQVAREKRGPHFLTDMPIVVTYFGNCLGNHEHHEWDFFRTVFTAIPRPTPVALLTGVSLLRWKNEKRGGEPVDDVYYMDAFTLETPRHLLHEARFLESVDETGQPLSPDENNEFTASDSEPECIIPQHYLTPFGVAGRVYRFKYALRHDIRTSDGAHLLRKGSRILLYSIVKYDLPSLVAFLEGRGLMTSAPPKQFRILALKNGEEEYRYAVISSVRA